MKRGRVKTRKIVLLSASAALVTAAATFAAIMLVRAAELDRAISAYLASESATVICGAKQKYYVSSGKEGKTEREDEKTFSYSYLKAGDGYEVACDRFTVKDGFAYVGDKKAAVTDEDSACFYERAFEYHDRDLPTVGAPMLVYDPTEIARAIREYRFAFTAKRTSGAATEYRIYFGNGFYDHILRNAFKYAAERTVSHSFTEPLIVTVENGKLKKVSFCVKGAFKNDTSDGVASRTECEYYADITYSDQGSVSAPEGSYETGFYKKFVPRELAEVGGHYAKAAFYKGKAYVADCPPGGGTVFKMIDLATGEVETEKTLGESDLGVTTVFIREGYFYVVTDGDDYEYDVAADTVRRKENCSVIAVAEDGVYVAIDGVNYFGADFGDMAETDLVPPVYLAEAKKYYRFGTVDGARAAVALVTADGEVVKEAEYDRISRNSFGFVAATKDEGGFSQKQLNFDLEEVGQVDDDFDYLSGAYVGSTDGYLVYRGYMKNAETGERLFISVSDGAAFEGAYFYGGEAYCLIDGKLFTTSSFAIERAEENLFSFGM